MPAHRPFHQAKTAFSFGIFNPALNLIPLGSGTLDASELGSFPLTITNAALLDVSIYRQAILGMPRSLTNLEITTPTGFWRGFGSTASRGPQRRAS